MVELSLAVLIAGGISLFVLGFVAGGWLLRRTDEDRRMALHFERELAEARSELERYRDRVSQHFEQSSDLFRDLTQQYSSLYKHLAAGARDLGRKNLAAFETAAESLRLESSTGAGEDAENEAPAAAPHDERREAE